VRIASAARSLGAEAPAPEALGPEHDAALLHEHRAALLEQVGLVDAAAFERRSATEER
jgi:hypothetical protein